MNSDFTVLLPVGKKRAKLKALYAVPPQPWLRANMVSTIDGAASGPDGQTDSVNNDADKEVFHLLRSQADAIIVGAGTVRAEKYRPTDRPLVVVTRNGAVPPTLQGAPRGSVVIATTNSATEVESTRAALGEENVLTLGEDAVDLWQLKAALVARGLSSLLCEGGPGLLRDALAAGVIDELCLTWVPLLLAGDPHRLLSGDPIDVPMTLTMLLEQEGTLLGRWLIESS